MFKIHGIVDTSYAYACTGDTKICGSSFTKMNNLQIIITMHVKTFQTNQIIVKIFGHSNLHVE